MDYMTTAHCPLLYRSVTHVNYFSMPLEIHKLIRLNHAIETGGAAIIYRLRFLLHEVFLLTSDRILMLYNDCLRSDGSTEI